jgi:hypothetical protein
MGGPSLPRIRRAIAVAGAPIVLAAPAAATADVRVTSLRPWAPDNLYYVREDLDGRTQPTLEPRAVVDHLRAGQWVRIECQTPGEEAYGSAVWDRVGGLYVPDAYIRTYTTGFLAHRIGKVVRYRLVRNRAPVGRTLCLRPGAPAPHRCD